MQLACEEAAEGGERLIADRVPGLECDARLANRTRRSEMSGVGPMQKPRNTGAADLATHEVPRCVTEALERGSDIVVRTRGDKAAGVVELDHRRKVPLPTCRQKRPVVGVERHQRFGDGLKRRDGSTPATRTRRVSVQAFVESVGGRLETVEV